MTFRILGRWLKAFGRPNSVLDRVNKVQSDIVDIRRLCDELLDKNVHLIKQLNLGKSFSRFVRALSMLIGWIDQKRTIEGKIEHPQVISIPLTECHTGLEDQIKRTPFPVLSMKIR